MLKEEIEKLIKNTKNSKSYAQVASRNPILSTLLQEYIKENHLASVPEAIYCVHYGVESVKCPCGKKALFNTFNKGYRDFCSMSCPEKGKKHSKTIVKQWQDQEKLEQMIRNREATNLEKYGHKNASANEEVKRKTAKTNMERYGAEMPLSSRIIQDKIKANNLKKIGVEFPFQSVDIRQKALESFERNHGKKNDMSIPRAAFIEKHGKNPFQVPWVEENRRNTMIERYGASRPLQSAQFLEKCQSTTFEKHGRINPGQLRMSQKAYDFLSDQKLFTEELKTNSITDICEKYSVSRSNVYDYHDRYDLNILPATSRSRVEDEVASALDSLGLVYHRNYNKLCYPNQVDFFIPDHNLAIEFNGLYWHSEVRGKKDRQYHQLKTQQCREHGVQLLTIFEDEWRDKHSIIMDKIEFKCNLSHNELPLDSISVIEESYSTDIQYFTNTNSINEFHTMADRYYVGRINNVICATLLIKNISDDTVEIIGHCAISEWLNYNLFPKFISCISHDNKMKHIRAIADLRWNSGEIYKTSKFTIVEEVSASYQYTDYINRISPTLIEFVDSNLQEFETNRDHRDNSPRMKDRIWDCGKLKFELKL